MVSWPFRSWHLRKHSSEGRSNTTTSTGIPFVDAAVTSDDDVSDADGDESLVASSAASIAVVSVSVVVAADPSNSIGSDDIVVVDDEK